MKGGSIEEMNEELERHIYVGVRGREGKVHEGMFTEISPAVCCHSLPEEARILLLGGKGQENSPALRGGRSQCPSQMAEERPGDQIFSQVRAQKHEDPHSYTSTHYPRTAKFVN